MDYCVSQVSYDMYGMNGTNEIHGMILWTVKIIHHFQ